MARFHSSSVAAHVGAPMTGTTASSGPGALLGVATAPGGPIRPDRDADLVAKLRAQAPDAVETLVARYGDLLYRLAVGITGNAEDAEEVAQDALWAAISRIETFRDQSAFGSWLYRIAANAAYGARRKHRHARQDVSWDEVGPTLTEPGQQLAPSTDWCRRRWPLTVKGRLDPAGIPTKEAA